MRPEEYNAIKERIERYKFLEKQISRCDDLIKSNDEPLCDYAERTVKIETNSIRLPREKVSKVIDTIKEYRSEIKSELDHL